MEDYNLKQWILTSAIAAAGVGALVYLKRSLSESSRALERLRAAQPKPQAPKRPQTPSKHVLGQVALPKSTLYPTPPEVEEDYPMSLSPELLQELESFPPAASYPLSAEQLEVPNARSLLRPSPHPCVF